jgi:hypothetical protein
MYCISRSAMGFFGRIDATSGTALRWDISMTAGRVRGGRPSVRVV